MRVSPALETLTPREADALAMSPTLLAQWLDAHGVEWHRSLMVFLFDRASEAQPAPVDDPRRADATELRVFVERAARLPPRLQQVAQLCLEEKRSLSAGGPSTECRLRASWPSPSCLLALASS